MDFSSRVTHYEGKNLRILSYGKQSFLSIIKSRKGGHRNLPKQLKCHFLLLLEPVRPISGATF